MRGSDSWPHTVNCLCKGLRLGARCGYNCALSTYDYKVLVVTLESIYMVRLNDPVFSLSYTVRDKGATREAHKFDI